MHGVAPAAAGIEYDRQLAGGAHVHRHLRHFGQRDVGFGHAFVPAERAATHIDRLEAGFLGQPRHDRIECDRRDDEPIAPDELTQCLQWMLLRVLDAWTGRARIAQAVLGMARARVNIPLRKCHPAVCMRQLENQSSFTPLALIGTAHFSISLSTKVCR